MVIVQRMLGVLGIALITIIFLSGASVMAQYDWEVVTTDDLSMIYGFRTFFFAEGRYWAIFYDTDGVEYYASSIDLQNWDVHALTTSDDPPIQPYGFLLARYNSKVQIVTYDSAPSNMIYFEGTPCSNGTLLTSTASFLYQGGPQEDQVGVGFDQAGKPFVLTTTNMLHYLKLYKWNGTGWSTDVVSEEDYVDLRQLNCHLLSNGSILLTCQFVARLDPDNSFEVIMGSDPDFEWIHSSALYNNTLYWAYDFYDDTTGYYGIKVIQYDVTTGTSKQLEVLDEINSIWTIDVFVDYNQALQKPIILLCSEPDPGEGDDEYYMYFITCDFSGTPTYNITRSSQSMSWDYCAENSFWKVADTKYLALAYSVDGNPAYVWALEEQEETSNIPESGIPGAWHIIAYDTYVIFDNPLYYYSYSVDNPTNNTYFIWTYPWVNTTYEIYPNSYTAKSFGLSCRNSNISVQHIYWELYDPKTTLFAIPYGNDWTFVRAYYNSTPPKGVAFGYNGFTVVPEEQYSKNYNQFLNAKTKAVYVNYAQKWLECKFKTSGADPFGQGDDRYKLELLWTQGDWYQATQGGSIVLEGEGDFGEYVPPLTGGGGGSSSPGSSTNLPTAPIQNVAEGAQNILQDVGSAINDAVQSLPEPLRTPVAITIVGLPLILLILILVGTGSVLKGGRLR